VGGVVAGATGACGGGRAPGAVGAASGAFGAPASGGADAACPDELDAPGSGVTPPVTDGDGTYRGRDAGGAVAAGGSRAGAAGSGVLAEEPAPAEVDALGDRGWVSRVAPTGAGARRGGVLFAATAGDGCKLTMTVWSRSGTGSARNGMYPAASAVTTSGVRERVRRRWRSVTRTPSTRSAISALSGSTAKVIATSSDRCDAGAGGGGGGGTATVTSPAAARFDEPARAPTTTPVTTIAAPMQATASARIARRRGRGAGT